jgi:hypothetical protein
VGLLTKIFGNGEGRAEGANERSGEDAEGSGVTEIGGGDHSSPLPAEAGSSGLRTSLDAAAPRDGRRRPEHPRLYLRVTPVRVEPIVPGARRPQGSGRRKALEGATSRIPLQFVPTATLERSDTDTITRRVSGRESNGYVPSDRAVTEDHDVQRRALLREAMSREGGSRDAGSRESVSRRRLSEAGSSEGSIPKEGSTAARLGLNGSRSKTALVVSPISLTPEELALPRGRRPMPTLVGLGAALSTGREGSPGSERPPPLPDSTDAEVEAAFEGATRPREAVKGGVRDANGVQNGGAAARVRDDVADYVPSRYTDDEDDPDEIDASDQLEADDALGDFDATGDLIEDDGEPDADGGDPTGADTAAREITARDIAAKDIAAQDNAPQRLVATASASTAPDAPSQDEIDTALHVLADYSVRLWLGPVSSAWVAEVERAVTLLESAPSVVRRPGSAATLSRLKELAAIGSREEILQVVAALPLTLEQWPRWASDLASEARRREQSILGELFVALDGLKAPLRRQVAEESTLERLSRASAEVLSEYFETPLERAAELAGILAAYVREREARVPEVDNYDSVWAALSELEARTREFEDCDEEQSGELRAARKRRRDAVTRINLLLSERGEHALLEELVPCAVSERIRRLRTRFGNPAQGQY